MKNSALVVIDLQNDITKNYREIIDNVNRAIDFALEKNMFMLRRRTIRVQFIITIFAFPNVASVLNVIWVECKNSLSKIW